MDRADDGLTRLAGLHGIESGYRDVWGKWRLAPDSTLQRILAVLDVNAATPEDVEREIAKFDLESQQPLPATVVIKRSVIAAGLRLAWPSTASSLAWQVLEETGRLHVGQVMAADLPAVEHGGDNARLLRLPAAIDFGYHRLSLRFDGQLLADSTLIVVPDRCYLPEKLRAGGRIWGAAMQLYALRSRRNWGVGDFSDLRQAAAVLGKAGAGFIGTNPLHALFAHEPRHISPYNPSSRLFLNLLYLDVEAIEEFSESASLRKLCSTPEFSSRCQALRDQQLIDYPAVAALKWPVFELLYRQFRENHLDRGTARAGDFQAFCKSQGEALTHYAVFEALQAHLSATNGGAWGWQSWPPEYRHPASPAVAAFATEQAERVELFKYLQWQAAVQLRAVAGECSATDMAAGLYTDIAVSIDRGGAETWMNQELYALDVSVGAPPDAFNPQGQDWGLPPLIPARLKQAAYAPLIATLRANMAHSGLVRIDHVMGLGRLYWIPAGTPAVEGAYVRYTLDDALGILALESHRQQCAVIGEDLGTVPENFRNLLEQAGVLSYRLLLFECDDAGQYKPATAYPRQALAAFSTHDLPTILGHWHGLDLALREKFQLFGESAGLELEQARRNRDCKALLDLLQRENLIAAGSPGCDDDVEMERRLTLAIYGFLARTESVMMAVQMEDVAACRDQTNFPGTVDQYPNWRRKLPLLLEDWPADALFVALTALLGELRGHGKS